MDYFNTIDTPGVIIDPSVTTPRRGQGPISQAVRSAVGAVGDAITDVGQSPRVQATLGVPAQLGGEGGANRGYPVAAPAGGSIRDPDAPGSSPPTEPVLTAAAPSVVSGAPAAAPAAGPISQGGMTGFGNDLGAIRAELARRAALENQNLQQSNNAMAANAAYGAAYTKDAAAQRAADFSAFRATDGADVVLARNSGSPVQAAQVSDVYARKAAADRATANTTAADLVKAQGGLQTGRNYIGELGQLEKGAAETTTAKALETTAGARVTEAGARAGLESAQAAGIKLTNEQHQKVSELANIVGTGTTEESQKAERQILALAGKTPEDWGVIHLAGQVRVDPVTGMPAGKDPDTALIYNKRTGQSSVLGGGAQQPKGAAPSPAEVAMLKKNPATAKQFEAANPGYKASDYLK